MSEVGDGLNKEAFWGDLLRVFMNETRVEILRLFFGSRWLTLGEIKQKLQTQHHRKISTPGVLKHVKELEKSGIIKAEWKGGWRLEQSDARKTLYKMEGKKRVKHVLQLLENEIAKSLIAGEIVQKIEHLTMEVQKLGPGIREKMALLENLISESEDHQISCCLDDDDKKKVELGRVICVWAKKNLGFTQKTR